MCQYEGALIATVKVLRVAVSSESGELREGGKERELTDKTQYA